jgi:hypothetical protein
MANSHKSQLKEKPGLSAELKEKLRQFLMRLSDPVLIGRLKRFDGSGAGFVTV